MDYMELWSSAWPAGLTMLGLGSGFAVVLLIASIKLKVEIDPKIEQIHEALPNVDCGACGFAGCGQYAKAVSSNPELLGKCAPGGPETASKIAGILNLQISDSGPAERPIVYCRAHTADKTLYGKYKGIFSCTAANALANVQACKFGCLGFGDCTMVCQFDALEMVDGLATVDYEKCTGCGACSRACPRNLIEMVPFAQDNMMTVACSSKEKGKSTRGMCKVGCIGCGVCAKKSEQNMSRARKQKRPLKNARRALSSTSAGTHRRRDLQKNQQVPRKPQLPKKTNQKKTNPPYLYQRITP